MVEAKAGHAQVALDCEQRNRAVRLRAARGGRAALVLLVRNVEVRDDDDADQPEQHPHHELDQAHAGFATQKDGGFH
jgi:hypothetical protein